MEYYYEYCELKMIGSWGDCNDDGGLGIWEWCREIEEWIVKEKFKEKVLLVVKFEMVEVKIKLVEEKDVKKEFVSLDEVNKDKIKVVLEKRRKLCVVLEFKF